MEPRIEAEIQAFAVSCQPGSRRICNEAFIGEDLGVRLGADLQFITPIDEDIGAILEDERGTGRSGEAGQPGKALRMGRNIFTLMLVCARNQKSVKAKFGHFRAQLRNAWAAIGRICGDVETLKSHRFNSLKTGIRRGSNGLLFQMNCYPAFAMQRLLVGESLCLIGSEHCIVLTVKYSGKNDGTAGCQMLLEGRCQLDKRIGKNVGDDQVEWRIGTEDRVAEAFRRCRNDMFCHTVLGGIFCGDGDSDRIDIGSQYRNGSELGYGDGKNSAAGAKVERIGRMFAVDSFLDQFKASCRRSVMAGAEGKTSIDFNGDVACFDLVAVVRAMDKETPGSDRLQTFQRMRDPVDVGQFFNGENVRTDQRIDPLGDIFGIVLDIDRYLENLPVFIDFGDSDGEAVFLESLFENVVDALGFCLIRRKEKS